MFFRSFKPCVNQFNILFWEGTLAMLQKFKAWLKGNHLEWIDEKPEFGDRTIQVQVTLLENETDLEAKARGRKMAEILENLSMIQSMPNLDPVLWQREIRQDRSLPGR